MVRPLTPSIEMLTANYPKRVQKTGEFGGKLVDTELQKLMDQLPGTPCCVQMSHALNMVGQLVSGDRFPGSRRDPQPFRYKGNDFYYILAVDEMENYMTYTYGQGELITTDSDGAVRSAADIKHYLSGRTGILVMRRGPYGVHTELWDGKSLFQKDMAVDALLQVPKLLFWDCGPPQWLQDWAKTS